MARASVGLRKDVFVSSDGRGVISEKKAGQALERLKRRRQIVDYIDTRGMDLWDSKGVDFIIILSIGAHYKTAFLQIKSSLIGAMKHRSIHPHPVVIVNQRDSVEDICVKILKKIQRES